jgi:hypothetical protein
VSVQDLKHAVEFIKREAGDGGLTGEGFAQVIVALFEKVHPLAIGALEQSYTLSKLITQRMLSTHMDSSNEKEAAEITRLADTLCDGYKSHIFPIGLLEAKRLGLKITEPDEKLYDAMWKLLNYYRGLDRSPKPLPGSASSLFGGALKGKVLSRPIGHVDSTNVRFDCVGFAEVVAAGVENRGANWLLLS